MTIKEILERIEHLRPDENEIAYMNNHPNYNYLCGRLDGRTGMFDEIIEELKRIETEGE